MKGNIALKNGQFDQAEQHFQIASRFPLGGTNDKAFVLIHLANLALRKKDKERSTAYIKRAKELAVTPRAKDIITKIEIEANGL
jgi:Tfp pilus assembly protein PilF